MHVYMLELAVCGSLGLGALASGLSATVPVSGGGAQAPLETVALDDILSARLVLRGGEGFLHRVDVAPDGTVSRLEIVSGTRWPWMRGLVDTRSVWVPADGAGYSAEQRLVTMSEGNLLAAQTKTGEQTLNVRSIAPSFLLGSRIDPPGEVDHATVLDIRRPEGAAMTFRVREETVLPWRTGAVVEFTSDCASFRPRERVIQLGDCPAAA